MDIYDLLNDAGINAIDLLNDFSYRTEEYIEAIDICLGNIDLDKVKLSDLQNIKKKLKELIADKLERLFLRDNCNIY